MGDTCGSTRMGFLAPIEIPKVSTNLPVIVDFDDLTHDLVLSRLGNVEDPGSSYLSSRILDTASSQICSTDQRALPVGHADWVKVRLRTMGLEEPCAPGWTIFASPVRPRSLSDRRCRSRGCPRGCDDFFIILSGFSDNSGSRTGTACSPT